MWCDREREMSLVDYASSDEDETEVKGGDNHNLHIPNEKPTTLPNDDQQPHPQPLPRNERSVMSVQQSDSSYNQPEPASLRLPDASLLLDSPAIPSNMASVYDHSSRVAAAMAQNASRKRESKESTSTYPRGKIPRGSLPHTRNVPETVGDHLRPPQLSGRSNIVTEDISKLFVKRNAEPTSTRSPSQ